MNASAGASILHVPVKIVVAYSETNLGVTPNPCCGVPLLTRRVAVGVQYSADEWNERSQPRFRTSTARIFAVLSELRPGK